MDIEKLWELLYKERNTASLQDLPETFFEDVSTYINKLETEKREADEHRKGFVEDEIKNARTKVEDIIKRRIGKIIKLASSGMSTQPKGMMDEEKMLFEAVKSHVDESRERLFVSIWGESKEEKRELIKSAEEKAADPTVSTVEKDATIVESEDKEPLHIVRVLDDIPTFMGTDGRIYKVRKEDVIMLPKTNAEILCKRGVAVRFEGKKEVSNEGEIEK